MPQTNFGPTDKHKAAARITAGFHKDPAPVEKANADTLEKGGEGSKGGKIVGHTKSGKPVYMKSGGASKYGDLDKHIYEAHKDFTPEDHDDAAEIHKEHYHKELDEAADGKRTPLATDHKYHREAHEHASVVVYQENEKVKADTEHKEKETHNKSLQQKIKKLHSLPANKTNVARIAELESQLKKSVDVSSKDPIEKAFASVLGVEAPVDPIEKAFDELLKCGDMMAYKAKEKKKDEVEKSDDDDDEDSDD